MERNKIYSLADIAGMSIGLASGMLVMLYLKDEVSFDRFHKDVNNIYRVVTESTYKGETHKDGNTGNLQWPRFAQNVPEIQKFVRVKRGSQDIKAGTTQSLVLPGSRLWS